MLESAVTYDGLPIHSGGAHGLGRITARDAFRSWQRFLSTCAYSSTIESVFWFPETPGPTVEPEVARLIEDSFPESGLRTRSVSWDRVDEALSLFESLEPLPTNQWGMAAVWLWFSADFQLRDPEGRLWPGQDPALFGHFPYGPGIALGTSSTHLGLQARRVMGLQLSIPNATDADLDRVVPWLQAALPMKLSAKQWTQWTLARNRRSYRGRKIVPKALATDSRYRPKT